MTPDFHYRSVIGKLNFLEKSTRPDISVSVHQCARFSEHPKRSHAEAVKRIGRYLLSTKDKGLQIHTNELKFFECWVDADFSGNWRQKDVHNDPMTAKSRSGWVIRFAGAPITWASKIQTITALSTTEAEYIALSTSLREVIPLMGILKEATDHGSADHQRAPKNPLHGFRRQQRRVGIGSLTENEATDETHKSVVSSLPGARRKAGNYSAGHTD